MLDEQSKTRNMGALVDAAFANYRAAFSMQITFASAISGLFIAVVILLSILGLMVIWPAVPNFTGIAAVTDGIVLGVFAVVLLLFSGFFLMWQGAVAATICRQPGADIASLAKPVGRAALAALSLLLANITIFLPIIAILGTIIGLNLSNAPTLLPILAIVLLAAIVTLRALGFFAVNIAIADGKRFFGAIIASARLVKQRGFLRILILTTVITALNAAIFAAIFLLLLSILGEVPTDLFGLLEILANPLPMAVSLLFAYIPTIFISPKLSVLAHSFYEPVNTPQHAAALPSRGLSTVADISLVAAAFAAVFYAASMIFSGGTYNPFQINAGATITTIIAFFAVFTIYNIYFEVFEGGQTPGKRLFGLIVIDGQESAPNFMQSLVRNVLRIVDIFGFVAMIFGKEHQRLGDMLSLTTVEYLREDD